MELQCPRLVLAFVGFSLLVLPLSATDDRIVGGRPALEGELPYQVSIRRAFNDKHFCGGSIINKDFILTAAHCMFYQWGGVLYHEAVSVVVGQLNITVTKDTIYGNASQIIIHPNYNKITSEYDVALIRLKKSLPISNLILPVNMAVIDSPFIKDCIVSGWGAEQYEAKVYPERLLATLVDRITNEQCNQMYASKEISIFESMMCAHDYRGEHDACQGDSGGPLVCSGLLYGVVSTGEGCADKRYPGIYASVPHLYDWIIQNSDVGFNQTDTTTTPFVKASSTSDDSEDTEYSTTKAKEREDEWLKELFRFNAAAHLSHVGVVVIALINMCHIFM